MRARPHTGADPTTRSLDPLDTLLSLGDTLAIVIPEDPIGRVIVPSELEVATGGVLAGVSVRVSGRGARATAARAGTHRGTRPRFPCFMFATCSKTDITISVEDNHIKHLQR